jgi:uncharacterized coiled-coil protein SlyX
MQTPEELRTQIADTQISIDRARNYLTRIQPRLGDPVANAIRARLELRQNHLDTLERRLEQEFPQ